MITHKKLILLFLSFLMFAPIFAQDVDLEKYLNRNKGVKYPNIIKLNTLAIPFNNISLSYERSIKPRLSAGIGVGFKYGGLAPKIFSTEGSKIKLDMDEVYGFTLTPEIRYYLRACDRNKQEGFYAGMYFRYTYYLTAVKFDYLRVDKPIEYIHADMAMTEFGVGIQIGYQFILWERLSVDFLFIGPRITRYNLGYKFDQMPSDQFFDDLSEYINEVIDDFGFDYNVEIKQQGEAKATTSFSFVGTRFGISLGFAF